MSLFKTIFDSIDHAIINSEMVGQSPSVTEMYFTLATKFVKSKTVSNSESMISMDRIGKETPLSVLNASILVSLLIYGKNMRVSALYIIVGGAELEESNLTARAGKGQGYLSKNT